MERSRLVKAKRRILAFTSVFPFHLIIIYIIFARTSLYVMGTASGKNMRFRLTTLLATVLLKSCIP